MKTIIFYCFLILFPFFLFAQEQIRPLGNEDEKIDSTELENQKVKRNFSLVDSSAKEHSYKKAMLFSLMLPGLGQVYNSIGNPHGKNSYWKIPIIYAGIGLATYFAIDNNNQRKIFEDEYNNRQDTSFVDFNPNLIGFSDNALVEQVNNFKFYRDLSIFAAAVIYGLNIMEAGVSAHFYNFNVTRNMDMSWRPESSLNGSLGLALTFNMHNRARIHKKPNIVRGF